MGFKEDLRKEFTRRSEEKEDSDSAYSSLSLSLFHLEAISSRAPSCEWSGVLRVLCILYDVRDVRYVLCVEVCCLCNVLRFGCVLCIECV